MSIQRILEGRGARTAIRRRRRKRDSEDVQLFGNYVPRLLLFVLPAGESLERIHALLNCIHFQNKIDVRIIAALWQQCNMLDRCSLRKEGNGRTFGRLRRVCVDECCQCCARFRHIVFGSIPCPIHLSDVLWVVCYGGQRQGAGKGRAYVSPLTMQIYSGVNRESN